MIKINKFKQYTAHAWPDVFIYREQSMADNMNIHVADHMNTLLIIDFVLMLCLYSVKSLLWLFN